MPASIVIPCKGRLKHLMTTVPAHLKVLPEGEFELIIVDYACPDKTFEWVKKLNHPAVKCCRLRTESPYFNASHCRNVGSKFASYSILGFCDADVHPTTSDWLTDCMEKLKDTRLSMCMPDWKRGGCGVCFTHATDFTAIHGFDEAMKGWGYEDIDLKRRLLGVGDIYFYPASYIKVLKHARDDSVRFYEDKRVRGGIPVTNEINKRISTSRVEAVNPSGYGLGDIEFWSA